MAEIMVLGAGMVGVSSALALQSNGHNVILVDRSAPGSETSYGNAGIIQAEAAEPYALPRQLQTILKYGLGLSNDVLWHPSAIIQMLPSLLAYYKHSAPSRHKQISEIYAQLTSRSTSDHTPLIADADAEELVSREGLAMIYRNSKDFAAAAETAERYRREYGVTSRILSGDAYCAEEAALKKCPAGVVHWEQSWSCSDPGELTARYAKLFNHRGGTLKYGRAETLVQTSLGWCVECNDGPVEAESAVVALGPWAPDLLKTLGYRIPMIYKRGYHAHFESPLVLKRPLLDASNGVVAASMTQGLRVSSGAALVNRDSPAEPRQLERGTKALKSILQIGQRLDEPQWFGTRPCLPDMLPLVGEAPNHKGLWFNFGHGHQGFTLGPTTAILLKQAMDGQTSALHEALSPNGRISA
ncbi:FAD-binding oxidoreductase [uncultured Marinobacter sp.]|uniref:NAD(P)/FAD-dependent oxidoreductase n=1 Tax=uncultured Marinobacter sp. TaxID=187379 RepID=UPI0025E36DD6|nr:FAD-binding oxidoreductase [uncultured Marinobacter sp.]